MRPRGNESAVALEEKDCRIGMQSPAWGRRGRAAAIRIRFVWRSLRRATGGKRAVLSLIGFAARMGRTRKLSRSLRGMDFGPLARSLGGDGRVMAESDMSTGAQGTGDRTAVRYERLARIRQRPRRLPCSSALLRGLRASGGGHRAVCTAGRCGPVLSVLSESQRARNDYCYFKVPCLQCVVPDALSSAARRHWRRYGTYLSTTAAP